MKVTVVPASTRTGRAALEHLLSTESPGLAIQGIYRDLTKVPENLKTNPAFEAQKGDVASSETLDFSGSDVVISITPPLAFTASDVVSEAKRLAENVAEAARRGKVRRVVYVSSMGAQHESGTGEIATNHVAEKALTGSAPEVVFIRCAYFMENWAMAVGHGLKADPPFVCTTISPASHAVPMISVNDVGAYSASQALSTDIQPSNQPHITELQGPQDYSSLDAQRALEDLTGKKIELRVIEPEGVGAFFGNVFPPHVVPLFVEMNATLLPGSKYLVDPENKTPVHRGRDTLMDAMRKMPQ